MSNLTIWKSAAVGRSTGLLLRCQECGVILSNMEAPDGVTGCATVFCPRCQKTTMATAFSFCTGDVEPIKVAPGERRRLSFVTYWRCRVEDTLRNWLVKRDFIRLGVDGVWCVFSPEDACDTIKDSDDPKQYTVEPVRMTMRQFNRIHEFGGY